MKKLTKANVAMNGFVSKLIELVKEWEPGSFTRELKYRDSLLQYIAENVPSNCRVEKEYRHNGTTTDLFLKWSGFMVNEEVFIEVKMNMNKKATLDRLVGQLESLEPGERNIIVVLVGETNAALVKRLQEKYERYASGLVPVPLYETLDIVVK